MKSPGRYPGLFIYPLYSGPFTLAEGTRSLAGFSVDNVGNAEKLKKRILHVDGTPPATSLTIMGVSYRGEDDAASADEGDNVEVVAGDVLSRGVMSGLATTYMLVDVEPEFCESGGHGGGVNGAGSCENPYYQAPFTLAVGSHTVHYSAMDHVGNKAKIKKARIEVRKKAPFPIAYGFSGKFPLNNEYFAARDAAGRAI